MDLHHLSAVEREVIINRGRGYDKKRVMYANSSLTEGGDRGNDLLCKKR